MTTDCLECWALSQKLFRHRRPRVCGVCAQENVIPIATARVKRGRSPRPAASVEQRKAVLAETIARQNRTLGGARWWAKLVERATRRP